MITAERNDLVCGVKGNTHHAPMQMHNASVAIDGTAHMNPFVQMMPN
jgi:hypothetical protein